MVDTFDRFFPLLKLFLLQFFPLFFRFLQLRDLADWWWCLQVFNDRFSRGLSFRHS